MRVSASRSVAAARKAPFLVQPIRKRTVIKDLPVCVRVLHEGANRVAICLKCIPVSNVDRNSQRLRSRLHDGNSLRVTALVNKKCSALAAVDAGKHRHSLGGGGAFVQQ